MLLELERRGYECAYVRTSENWEVDFFATAPGARPLLVQVCADTSNPETLARETRALASARMEYPNAGALLITLDSQPPRVALPPGVTWMPASRWLLEPGDH